MSLKFHGPDNRNMLPWSACKDGACECGFVFDCSGEIHLLTVHNSDKLGADDYGADVALSQARQAELIAYVVGACNNFSRLRDALREIADAPQGDDLRAIARLALASAEGHAMTFTQGAIVGTAIAVLFAAPDLLRAMGVL